MYRTRHLKILSILICILILSFNCAFAQFYYVDVDSVGGTCGDGNSGSISSPWCTSAPANSTMVAGDTAYYRVGTYSGSGNVINPSNSGSSGSPITYTAYPGETAIITYTGGYAVSISGRSWITVSGLSILNSYRLAELDTATYCIFTGNTCSIYSGGGGSVSIFLYDGSQFNQITNNTINGANGYDIIRSVGTSHYNLIEGNTITNGNHALINIRTSYNVIKSNTLSNTSEKAAEIAWQNSGSWDVDGQAEYNVFEYNKVTSQTGLYNYAGLQLTGPRNIIRFNDFYGSDGDAIMIATTGLSACPSSDCDPFADNNRIYHNTIYANGMQSGWSISHAITMYEYNHTETGVESNYIINNLFYGNWPNYKNPNYPSTCEGTNDCLVTCLSTPAMNFTVDNCVLQIDVGSGVTGTANVFGTNQELYNTGWTQSNEDFKNPLFTNAAGLDFTLQSGSPYIDIGQALTATANSGTGTSIIVDDSYFFSAGITGLVSGDTIVIGTDVVTITAINYSTKTLTVTPSITWSVDDPVYFQYSGSAPDMGAHEYTTSITHAIFGGNGPVNISNTAP